MADKITDYFQVYVKRLLKAFLKNKIGKYIKDFSFEKFSVGRIKKLEFDLEALNEMCEKCNLPLEFLEGSVEYAKIVQLPIKSLLSDNIKLEVSGLKFVFQPKERAQDVSMFDSMWCSMESSLQLAEEYLNDQQEEVFPVPDRSEGIKRIANTIETVFSNLQIVFHDTSLKIEYMLPNKSTGISLEIKIKRTEFFDEAGANAPSSGITVEKEKNPNDHRSFAVKRFIFEGISVYTSEFLSEERPFSSFHTVFQSANVDSTVFIPGSPEMPPTHPSLPVKKTEANCNCEPVLISRLSGQQEIRLKLKQDEGVAGPKVDVEFNFGAFNLFLTPQQVHLLFTLFNGIIKPVDRNGDTARKVQPSVANKPMRPADYALVQQEFMQQQEISDGETRSLKNQHGWSSHFLDESDEYFQLMNMDYKVYSDILPSSSQDDLLTSSTNSDSKSESSSSYSSASRHRGSTVQAILTDSLSELTHFHGCISSLLVIILHDDSVQETLTKDSRFDSVSLEVQAETFFHELLSVQFDGFNFKDFLSAREQLSKLCKSSHLRLMASGMQLDGNKTSSSTESNLKFNLLFHQFEILECLYNSPTLSNRDQNPIYMQVLNFPKQSEYISSVDDHCFKLSYSQIECTSQNRSNKPPANKLDIQFDAMVCDIDISLMDRIRTLLNFSGVPENTDNGFDHWKDSDIGMVTRTSSKTEVNLSSSHVTVNLRFPIPDLRSVHDMERAPWWQQNVHKEILILQFHKISFKTTLDDDELYKKYEVQCQDIHGLFQVQSTEEPISFLRISVDPETDEVYRNNGFNWPRLVIRSMSKVTSLDLESGLEENDDLFSCSISSALLANVTSEPSPFCSTSVIHDNKVDNEKNMNLSSDHDEIIKPADKENMQIFVEQTINKSKCVFEFTLPTVNIVFPDQDTFELLYNRLFNGLLLWEPTSLTSASVYESCGFKVHAPGLDIGFPKGPSHDQFPVFKPFVNDSNSDSEEEETMYMSIHEYYQRQKVKHKKTNNGNLTDFSFNFNITKGSLLVNTTLIDEDEKVIPSYCGKLQLRVEDASIFVAVSYKGDPNESYVCLVAEKSALYHEGMAPIQIRHSIVKPLTMDNTLKCIIYASDPGMPIKSAVNLENPHKEMLKFSVHVVRSLKQQIKTFKIAIEIASATLRHYIEASPQMWINQLIQFLKVSNYDVKGYIPPAVITELHLNLSNCAIDYRPLKLPYRTALTVENFNMSCNLTATTPSFLFRIISEELRFFMSNNTDAKQIDLRKNYVCVIDSGLIDISIRTSVDAKDNPKLEMSISNNKLHIRTCADSFKALLELITYLSLNGDMEPNYCTQKEDENVNIVTKTKNCDSDSENLDLLMAEAMKDCSRVLNGNEKAVNANSDFEYSNTDDEFCILEDDPGVGLIPKNGEPQVRVLTEEPIRIIENHFAIPPGKSDVLRAPKHFPNPLFMLTLQQMCLVWHLYGGNDFRKKISSMKKKLDVKSDHSYKSKQSVTFSDKEAVDNVAVSFCKVTPMANNFDSSIVQFSMEHITINENQKSFTPESWIYKGGSGRNHDVLMELQMSKIQFQKEVYPLDSEYSSRYILLVNDIEIRDRLSISQINKFLYHYSTKDLPRQSHANMIDVKAVYTRPDPKSATEECSLRVSCKPLRLNVDQDSLMFLIDFFQEVLEVPIDETYEGESEARGEKFMHPSKVMSNSTVYQNTSATHETFYRYFSFSPDVLIRIDYHGKRVQMEQGALKGLLMGLAQLSASEIKLKRLCYRHGLLGHNKLVRYALNEWQQDILKNQLPSLLGGVGPLYSFVQIFQGLKDLFYLPVVHYRRDGQIVRGIQKGASSFYTLTIVAALDLTSKFFNVLQGTAEIGYVMVNPANRADTFLRSQELYRKSSQPADLIEGVATAYNVIKEGLEDTARTIYHVASTEHEHKGVPGAVGGVLRQIPPSIFRPIILSSEATSYILDGARHQLMPDAHQEDIHKWKTKNN